jgi:hypothetical protein
MDAVWVLNLDADLELGARGPYTPTRSVLGAMRVWRDPLARALLAPGEALLDEDAPPRSAEGRPGRAFCPTTRAIAQLERAGAIVPPHPSMDVLRAVNGRAFAASLGETLPGAAFVTREDAAKDKLASAPPGADAWRVKRAFGMAGRGQRVIAAGTLERGDEDFVRAGVAEGGVMIEPNVAIVDEWAIHGMLTQAGALTLGAVVRQRCDARGVWIASERVDARPDVAPELEDEAALVARALHGAGYFGPFGVDAFTYRTPGGALALQRRSEINARYSMGFAAGFCGR